MTGAARRINSGRGHWYRLDGTKADGVTSILDNGIPKKALVGWAARETATFAWEKRAMLVDLDQPEAVDFLKGAPYRERDKAAKRGTEVHRVAERLARGEEVDVPQELAGHVDAYLKFRDDWQPENEIVEFIGGNRKHRYMGTGDLIATLPGLCECGLIDLKTNRSGPFGETALQIAAYRNFEFILDDQGDEIPMPAIDWTGCLWIRADGYELYPYEAGAAEFRAFLYAQQVAHFVTDRLDKVRGDALVPRKRAA